MIGAYFMLLVAELWPTLSYLKLWIDAWLELHE